MTMIDLKNTKDDQREKLETADEMEAPDYPWGLQITLNKETLDKLGMSITDFGIGDEIDARVMFKVQDLSKHQGEKYDSESVGLVITQAEFPKPAQDDKARADKIFGED